MPDGKGFSRLHPENFSAHEELAHLAEQADEPDLAAQHYEKAWKLRPDRRALLLSLARFGLRRIGRKKPPPHCSQRREARSRERGRSSGITPETLSICVRISRALDLDSSNAPLRRELAFLYVEMSNHGDAEKEFERVVQQSPGDLESTAQAPDCFAWNGEIQPEQRCYSRR